MAKRANGEGNIRKRKDGKWLVTFPTGIYKEDGKREYVYKYCVTQAEAAEKLRELQMEKAMGVCQGKSAVKTGAWIAITAGLVAVLREHKETMMKLAEDMGEEWSEESLVFRNSRGNMVYSRNLQEVLYRIYDKAEIEGATMHTLRHSYATRCFEAGVDIKAISEQLGHANVKTTYNIYVHLLEDTKAKEIDKLGEIDKFIA